jgi:hypothetical protein
MNRLLRSVDKSVDKVERQRKKMGWLKPRVVQENTGNEG